MAISGERVIVGAHGDDDNGSYSGSAYIYKSDGVFVAKVTAPDGAAMDYFGALVEASHARLLCPRVHVRVVSPGLCSRALAAWERLVGLAFVADARSLAMHARR